VLGLSDIVIFPGMVAPCSSNPRRASRLIDDVVAGDRFLGLVLQKRPEVENPLPRICGSRLRGARPQDAQVPRQHRAGLD